LLNYTDIKNEFPEIPYCKYKYEEVAEELNAHFKSQKIRITIREMFVETVNTECHGLVSGSNIQFKTIIEDGSFIEITVESIKTLRVFPTYIANSSNAKGNNERWNIYCDLTGDSYLSRDWMGEFSGNVQDYYLYSGTYVELNNLKNNCVSESVIQKLCYWGWRSNNSGEIGELLVTGGGIVPAIYFNIEKPFPQSWDQSEITYKCSDKEIEEILNLTTTTPATTTTTTPTTSTTTTPTTSTTTTATTSTTTTTLISGSAPTTTTTVAPTTTTTVAPTTTTTVAPTTTTTTTTIPNYSIVEIGNECFYNKNGNLIPLQGLVRITDGPFYDLSVSVTTSPFHNLAVMFTSFAVSCGQWSITDGPFYDFSIRITDGPFYDISIFETDFFPGVVIP
jgi:hypothetical protein